MKLQFTFIQLSAALAALLGALLSPVQARGQEGTAGEPLAPPPATEDPLRTPDVVVTGARTEERASESVVSTQVLTRDDLEASGAETVAEALEEIVGLEIVPDVAGQVVRVRGLDPQHTLVLVDGDRVIGRINGGIDLTRLAIEDVERIEIVRGGSSASYGSEASGGVIQIVTRRPTRRREASLHGTGGWLGDRNGGVPYDVSGTVGLARRRGEAQLTAGVHRLPAFRRDPGSPRTTASDVLETNVEGRTRVRLAEGHVLRVRLRGMRRDVTGVDASATGAVFDRHSRTSEAVLSLGTEHTLGEHQRLELHLVGTLFRDQYRSDQRGGPMDTLQDTHEQLLEARVLYALEPNVRHRFVAGVDTLGERLDTPRLSHVGERFRGAPYAEYRFRVTGRYGLAIVPGVRTDVDSQFGAFVSPKLATRVDLGEHAVVRGSVARGFRAPSFRELYLFFENPSVGYRVVGNPDLGPERSINLELGATLSPHEHVTIEATAFRNQLESMITTATDPADATGGTFTYVNLARAVTQGLELGLGLRPVTGLRLDLGYVFLDATREGELRYIEGRARHRGTLGVAYRHRGARLQVRAALTGKRPYYDGGTNLVHAPMWLSLDVRYAQALGDHVTLFVGADNLADAGDARTPIRPRGVYAGLDLRL